jgi:hypothetical protein
MEKGNPSALPASTTMYSSGRFNPGLRNKLDAVMFNGFLKAAGFEIFGTLEFAKGRNNTETDERKASQFAIEGLYRFGNMENLYLGARYNTVKAELQNSGSIVYDKDVEVNRFAVAAGWFITKNILLKGEIVNQKYRDFPSADFRNGGEFKGYVIEATIGF